MAAELGLLSLTQLQKLAQQRQQQQPQPAMWDYTGHLPANNDDDSWEVRAFAKDTSNAMGTTWPPRSYTCTFCRREFRSAQALGGHMNVHRRDRARLRQSPQVSDPSSSSAAATTSPPPMIFPSGEFVANGGVFFYPIQTSTGSVFVPSMDSSASTFLSISPYAQAINFPASSSNLGASLLAKVGMVRDDSEGKENSSDDGGVVEELDLELRLGW